MLAYVLAAAALLAALVFGVALAAVARRRSWSYLLVALALGTLLARALVGVLTMESVLDPDLHHVLEHGLDVAMAALVIAAVAVTRDARGGPA
ncbi:DUF7471 family protein [Halomarina litorea]|uniref:DUF7471 family protein n=1 Tax=Halomarina litorea TaxID=2961595 RepID=UPI0020C5660C|nr:hypothetical protein [Halomarina sp. BCD28]